MRILLPTVGLPPYLNGGGPISALILAQNLIAAGHDVLVLHAADKEERDEVDGVPVKRVPSPNVYWQYRDPHPILKKIIWHGLENYNPWAEKIVAKEIAEFKPDVVLSFSIENINVATWRAAAKAGVPCVHHACSTYLMCWKSTMIRDGRSCGSQCTSCKVTSLGKKAMSQYAQGLIGETQFIVDLHLENNYFKKAKTAIVPGSMTAVPGAKPRHRKPGDPLRVGFLGEVSELKAPDLLTHASHHIGDRKIEFYIGGHNQNEYAQKLKGQFAEGTTYFLGWTDPRRFFGEVDVVVLPSRGSEVFGRVTIEAYAHGIPAIGSDHCGIPESIEHGKTGLLFPLEDSETLSDHINRFYDDTEFFNTCAENALIKSRDYLPEASTARMTEFLEDIVADYRLNTAS